MQALFWNMHVGLFSQVVLSTMREHFVTQLSRLLSQKHPESALQLG